MLKKLHLVYRRKFSVSKFGNMFEIYPKNK
jgi:hypothetical protein